MISLIFLIIGLFFCAFLLIRTFVMAEMLYGMLNNVRLLYCVLNQKKKKKLVEFADTLPSEYKIFRFETVGRTRNRLFSNMLSIVTKKEKREVRE